MNRKTVAVLVLDGFSMLSFGSIVEPFSYLASEFPDIAPDILLVGYNGTRVRSQSGVIVECDVTVEELMKCLAVGRAPQTIIICSNTYGDPPVRGKIVPLLRRASRIGVSIYGLGSVTWLMAEIGILRGGKGTIHWKSLAAFAERFYDIDAENSLFVSNGMVASCAGELATLDMVIDIISTISPKGAESTAHHLLISFPRNGQTCQPGSQMARLRHAPDVLRKAIKAMVDNTEDPLSVEDIARHCHISIRHLERLFQRSLQTSPMRYYTKLKLEKAYELVSQTDSPLCDVALASGFSSTGLMSKKFRAHYNQTPAQYRMNANA